jgi:ethanolamine utilization protein EutA
MRREGIRYVVARRTILRESEILLTPYLDDSTIDVRALEAFIAGEYTRAGVKRNDVDTGALILTGVAVRRRNARAIGEMFAEEAGRFVAVSAGDRLEATLAAYGSGAAAESAKSGRICMNVDIGGGTSKFAICSNGGVLETTAIDIGARLIVLDENCQVIRLEEAGRVIAREVGLNPEPGDRIDPAEFQPMVSWMADRLLEIVTLKPLSPNADKLLRLPPLAYRGKIDAFTFSGGVSEFIYGQDPGDFGDLGALLASEVKRRIGRLNIPVSAPTARIRATVIGASQYTVQLSGSTIFVDPLDAVPVRNVPVVTPDFSFDHGDLASPAIESAVERALARMDLLEGKRPVAVAFHWEGSATFPRLQAFCAGIQRGLEKIIAKGHPLMLVSDGDIGGILGLHFKEEMNFSHPVISIDGIALSEFDYIDVGALIPSSGAVPVVIKSLVFPVSGRGS